MALFVHQLFNRPHLLQNHWELRTTHKQILHINKGEEVQERQQQTLGDNW